MLGLPDKDRNACPQEAPQAMTNPPETRESHEGQRNRDAPSKVSGSASFMRAMSLPSLLGLYLLW